MISIFAALNGSILSGSRVPFAAARDGLFFPSFARIHPQHRTPSVSILALSAWGAVLVLSGKYDELFTYVIFASVILYGMATASVIVLRIKRPDMPRPYRTLGYPVVPILFVAAIASLIVSTLLHSPRESLLGIAIITLGVPFYLFWSGKLPSTHWGVVLLLGVVTAGVSNVVWAILQAVFVKRIDSKNKAVLFYVLSLVVGVAGFLFSLDPEAALVASALYLIAAILFQIGNFQIRGAFERVGMRLNVVLTFFLGMLYFQYHLRRIRNEDPLPYWYRAASETTKKLPSE
jgi:amino acid transporter